MNEWKRIKLGEILEESKILESNENIYKRLSVKLHLGGVFPRDVRATDKIGSTRYYRRKAGQFIYGKQNLHNGAIGIIPRELDGYQSSSDLPTFDIDKSVNSKWLYYYFARKSFYKSLERLSNGTGSKRIKPDDLLNIDIRLPSSEEQQKIAAILSSVDEAIEKTEQIIEQTETVKKGLMQQILTKGIGYKEFQSTPLGKVPSRWKVKLLSEVSEHIFVGIATSTTNSYSESGVPIIRNQNILQDRLDTSEMLYITEEFSEKNRNKKLKAGDILTVRTGYPGVSCVVPISLEGAQTFTTLVTRPIHKIVNPYYLSRFINSQVGRKFVNGGKAGGAQQNLNVSTIKNMPVYVPPKVEQDKIVQILDSVENKVQNEKEKHYRLISLKQGLMQQLLTGKVRVPLDEKEEVPS